MNFGKIIDHEIDGDKAIETTTFVREGKEMHERRRTTIERRLVNNQLEESAEYHRFAKQYHQDPTMLNMKFEIEGKEQWTKGKNDYYYVVLSYMRVEK